MSTLKKPLDILVDPDLSEQFIRGHVIATAPIEIVELIKDRRFIAIYNIGNLEIIAETVGFSV